MADRETPVQSDAGRTYSYWDNQYLLAIIGMPLAGGLVVFWAFTAEVVGGGLWFRPFLCLTGIYFVCEGVLRAINPREFEIVGQRVRVTYLTGQVREWGLVDLLVRRRRLRGLLGESLAIEDKGTGRVVFRVFSELPDCKQLLGTIASAVA